MRPGPAGLPAATSIPSRPTPDCGRPRGRAKLAATEAFFAEHLGGRCEPVGSDRDGFSEEDR